MLLAGLPQVDPLIVIAFFMGFMLGLLSAVTISAQTLKVSCALMGVEPPLFPIAFAASFLVLVASIAVHILVLILFILARGGELPPIQSFREPTKLMRADIIASVVSTIGDLCISAAVYSSLLKIGTIRALIISVMQFILSLVVIFCLGLLYGLIFSAM